YDGMQRSPGHVRGARMENRQGSSVSRDQLDQVSRAGFKRIQELGYHLQPNDFYAPFNDVSFLDANRDLWHDPVPAVEIEWGPEGQLEVAAEVGRFVDELRDVPQRSHRPGEYCWDNAFWNNADALVQYGLVRSRQPRRYVEVGCGWSSLLLARA